MTVEIISHAKCVIVKRGYSCDLIDPVTGRWQVFKTPRAARWNATVWSRLSEDFGYVVPSEEDIEFCKRIALAKCLSSTLESSA